MGLVITQLTSRQTLRMQIIALLEYLQLLDPLGLRQYMYWVKKLIPAILLKTKQQVYAECFV